MTRNEYMLVVRVQLADMCVAALTGIPGLDDREAICTMNSELISALSKMLIMFDHETRVEIMKKLVAQSDIHHNDLTKRMGDHDAAN